MNLVLFSLGMLAACNGPKADDPITLDWSAGDTFHVAARYRLAEVMTEETTADLEGGSLSHFGENWSEDVTWTYQVVEAGLKPDSGDQLHPYSLRFDGSQTSLAVIKAWVDGGLNDDPSMLEADPVIYLVFREDNDRLAGLISFVNVDGERVERAYSSTELGRSWSALSQSMLTQLPTYLAPFGATWGEGTRKTENGGLVDTVEVDRKTTDVFFDDEVGGGLVAARYEFGQPWPTWTVSDSVDARLLTDEEVSSKRAERPMLMPEAPEDFDYRTALAASIDIEASLVLDEETLGGGWSSEVYEEFQPWAGSWWPLSKGELVFGYRSADTLSDRIKDEVDPIKESMDRLSEELREMEDGSDKDAKVEEYQAKQSELVDILVDFYGTVLQDLDGGRLSIANGELSHVDGWSIELDDLSPMDKFALELYDRGETYPNPFYMPAWEILNSYNPVGGSWWGHCNGWAAAAILTHEPTSSETVDINGNSVEFSTADLKGLLTEAHYSTYSRFYGSRYYKEGDDLADLYPKAFHTLITHYIKQQRIPLVFDTTAGDAVWNFPAWQAELLVDETTPEGLADLVNINTATFDELDELPQIGESKASAIISHREAYGPFQAKEEVMDVDGVGNGTYDDIENLITVDPIERTFDVVAEVKLTSDAVDETWVDSGDPESFTETWSYTLITDESGLVIGGEWDDDNQHPDFAWVPYNNPHSAGNGSSENPYLPYGSFLDVFGEDIERH